MKKKTSNLSASGYITPECETTGLAPVQILCASTRDGQIDDLYVEEEDPFTWV